jgi:hypothetical protein
MSYAQRRKFLWAILIAGLVLIAIVANATTLIHLQFQELVADSSAIARAHCLGVEVQMERGEIWTDTRFRVVESEKDNLPPTIVVRQLGGKLQNLQSRVDGSPEFRPGEEVYLFLVGRPDGKFNLVGWSQGTFRIRQNVRTKKETVTQDSAEVPVFNPESKTFEKTGVRNMPAEMFVERVRWEASRQPTLNRSLK